MWLSHFSKSVLFRPSFSQSRYAFISTNTHRQQHQQQDVFSQARRDTLFVQHRSGRLEASTLLSRRSLSTTQYLELAERAAGDDGTTVSVGHVKERRLSIQYTCKVCNTKQGPKEFSRHSYERGIVIVTCDSCCNHHIIADNFGWFSDLRGKRNIEEILVERGESIRRGEIFQLDVDEVDRSPLANNKLYETHIPTSGAEKLALSLNAALTAILDPHRGDMVAAMGETTPMIRTILEHLHQRMMRDVSGRELLRLRPRITNQTIDRDRLRMLPDGTLGREYVRFLDLLKTNPTARPPVKYIDDERLVYVMQRYRETHDFTHTLLQMRPNMLGEVTVKYFEAIQLGLPMCVSAAIFGGIRLGKNHRRQLLERNLPWVVRQAQQSRFLLALDWERRFEQSITDLQRKCSIEPLKTAGVTSPTG